MKEEMWHIDTENLPVMNLMQPVNIELCGIYGRTFAYYTLIERLPRIINQIIENCTAQEAKIKLACNASDYDLKNYIQHLTKLKTDLVTNQVYKLLRVDSPEARWWNAWIESQNNPRYFSNIWLYSECYVYRRIREASEVSNKLASFDPFEEQKNQAFHSTTEMMCVVAEKMTSMLKPSNKEKQRANFANLIKLCLWSNKCDLSLTLGKELSMDAAAGALLDPFRMINECKDNLLIDQSEQVADYVMSKAESITKVGLQVKVSLCFQNRDPESTAKLIRY